MELLLILLASIVISYALWFGILSIFKLGKPNQRKYYSLIPGLISLPVVFGLILYAVLYLPNREFNQNAWKQDVSTRHKMTKSLLDSKLLIGLSKQEITDLLGNDYTKLSDNAIAYNIHRPKILFSIDHDELIIHFDDNGIVENVREFAL